GGGVGQPTAERGRVSHLDQVQGDRGLGLTVHVQLGAEVVAGQDVAVEDDHRVVRAGVQQARRVADAAAGAQRNLFVHVVDGQAERGSVPEGVAEHLGPVGGGQHHVGDAGRGGPGELVAQERHARRGQQRLGGGQGEGAGAGG